MTTTEKNIFLAEFMEWSNYLDVVDGQKVQVFMVPNVFGEDRGETGCWASAMCFHSDWNWFQQAFQKFRQDFRTDPELQLRIEIAFTTNDIEMACDILIEFLKEKK